MAYAILRTAKLKEIGHIAGSLSHTFRTRETPNADQSRAHLNENSGPETPEAILNAIKDRLPEKVRANGVRCIEYFIGGSPDHFRGDDGAKYFEDARAWLIDRHGAENVISTHVHRDETTPHMVAYVVPITPDGKLSARHFLGGPDAMRQLQTDFAQEVGQKHGLERGVEGSKAKHQTIAEYYQRANSPARTGLVDFPKERQNKGLLAKESDIDFAGRVARAVHDEMVGNYVKGAELPAVQRRLKEAETTSKSLLKRASQAEEKAKAEIAAVKAAAKATILADRRAAEPWHRAIEGLTPALVAQLGQHLAETAQRIRLASEKVIGWIGSLRTDPQTGRDVFDLERQDNGGRVMLTSKATEDLMKAGVKHRDLVEANAFGGQILQRRHEHERVPGTPERGRGGMER